MEYDVPDKRGRGNAGRFNEETWELTFRHGSRERVVDVRRLLPPDVMGYNEPVRRLATDRDD